MTVMWSDNGDVTFACTDEQFTACSEWYESYYAENLVTLVSFVRGEEWARAPRVALLVMLAGKDAFGSHWASWKEHVDHVGFTATESESGWSCYAHDIHGQQD